MQVLTDAVKCWKVLVIGLLKKMSAQYTGIQLFISQNDEVRSLNMKNRIYGLDILRAIAILIVIAAHALSLVGNNTLIYDGVALFFIWAAFLLAASC